MTTTPSPTTALPLAPGQWALDTNQPYGIWGGLTEPQRRKLKRGVA